MIPAIIHLTLHPGCEFCPPLAAFNLPDDSDFLARWEAGQYIQINHVFRQEFYDKDPIVGPYLEGHGFLKDDTRNLIPLP